MDDEILACIEDKNVKYLYEGRIPDFVFPLKREKAHQKRICHLIIRFFIITETPDKEILYLIQKRSKNKRSYPEFFTDSASGHVLYKEDLKREDIREDALRELEEEFGIPPNDVMDMFFYNLIQEEDQFTKEVAYNFIGLVKYGIKLKPDPLELESKGSGFYSKSELETLLKKERIIGYAKKIWCELLNKDLMGIFNRRTQANIRENHKDEKETALFIGRFQPLHLGHLQVMEDIFKIYERVKIGIGSAHYSYTKRNPFTIEERKQFIISALESKGFKPDKYELYEIWDIHDPPNWVDHVISIVGHFDVLFSNSDFDRKLFQERGYIVSEKILFDRDRLQATQIRNSISKGNDDWKSSVPKEVIKLIIEFNGIDRIQSIYKE